MDGRYDRITGRLRERYREGRGSREPNLNFPEVAVAKCLPSRNRTQSFPNAPYSPRHGAPPPPIR